MKSPWLGIKVPVRKGVDCHEPSYPDLEVEQHLRSALEFPLAQLDACIARSYLTGDFRRGARAFDENVL